MPIIYRKTAKGVAEIETRQHRLTPRVRSALIVVDGRRDLVALRNLITQQADETLTLLLEQGFIEGAPPPATLGKVDIPTDAELLAPAPAPTSSAAAAAPADPSFDPRRRAAVRELNDILGPSGESLAIRMERARNADELKPLLLAAAQVIANARGRSAAEAYATRHGL